MSDGRRSVTCVLFKKLDCFSTGCIYAPYAVRNTARTDAKDWEVRYP